MIWLSPPPPQDQIEDFSDNRGEQQSQNPKELLHPENKYWSYIVVANKS